MGVIDDLLKLFGTSRIQLRWKWLKWREKIAEGRQMAKRRAEWAGYQHKICPQCAHPADRGDQECPACGAGLGSFAENRLARYTRWLAPDGASIYTALLTIFHLVLFAAAIHRGGPGALLSVPSHVADEIGAWSSDALADGEWWRLVTANFVHLGIFHLLMNGWALLQVCPMVEEHYGRSRFALIYLATGVAGMSLSAAVRWGVPAGSAGASAALFGMIGAALAYGMRARGAKHLRDGMIKWIIWIVIITALIPGIDHMAHLGGGIAGLALGLAVPAAESEPASPIWGALELASLLIVAASFVLLRLGELG